MNALLGSGSLCGVSDDPTERAERAVITFTDKLGMPYDDAYRLVKSARAARGGAKVQFQLHPDARLRLLPSSKRYQGFRFFPA